MDSGPTRRHPCAPRPTLLAWSARYSHLREATHDDVLAYFAEWLEYRQRRWPEGRISKHSGHRELGSRRDSRTVIGVRDRQPDG